MTIWTRKLGAFAPLLSVLLFCLALWVVHHALRDHSIHDLFAEVRSLPVRQIAFSAVLTAVSYAVLTGYDWLALRHVGRHVAYAKISLTAFISYVFSHNIGLSLLTGGSIRYRIYSAEGLSAMEIGTVTLFCTLTFGLGTTVISGLALLLEPSGVLSVLPLPATALQAAGAVCLGTAAGYVLWTRWRKTPFSLGSWSISPPRPSLGLAQIGLAVVDIGIATAAMYVLLPSETYVSFVGFMGIYVLAIAAGIISHVPGGVGVIEGVVLLLIPEVPATALLASLLAFRVIYYFIPLCLAALLLAGYELAQRSERLGRAVSAVTGIAATAAPPILGTFVLLGGAVLLLSGASPGVDSRLEFLRDIVPLSVLEASHLVGSLAGVGLLILARGLFRRLDGAYHLTVVLLAGGIAASLLKGLDYEEALLLIGVLATLVMGRKAFYRKASIISVPFSPSWIAAVSVILIGSIWLGLFSYKHVEYQNDLWWQFEFFADAPRFLRASFGAIAMALAFAFYRLLQPLAPPPDLPAPVDIDRAKSIISMSPSAAANLALVCDKHLLFSDAGNAFVMYGVQGRTWVAMGDPIGPKSEHADLAWKFRDLCDRYNGRPVFYQVGYESLPIYLDMGLTLLKLGEEARIPLGTFSLDGSRRKDLRHAQRRAAKEGAVFEVVDARTTAMIMPDLAAVSTAWLAEKKTAEKRFSVGRFEPGYLGLFPCAVVRVGKRIVAFANVWTSADNDELSVDLMRHVPDAPYGVMDYLFVELMLWGRRQGYRWFSLGIAPLSGLEDHPLAPLWHRAGLFVFHHGEHFYNFEGLRFYKEKFDPVWKPRYLASTGSLAATRALLDIGRLIAGGAKGIVTK